MNEFNSVFAGFEAPSNSKLFTDQDIKDFARRLKHTSTKNTEDINPIIMVGDDHYNMTNSEDKKLFSEKNIDHIGAALSDHLSDQCNGYKHHNAFVKKGNEFFTTSQHIVDSAKIVKSQLDNFFWIRDYSYNILTGLTFMFTLFVAYKATDAIDEGAKIPIIDGFPEGPNVGKTFSALRTFSLVTTDNSLRLFMLSLLLIPKVFPKLSNFFSHNKELSLSSSNFSKKWFKFLLEEQSQKEFSHVPQVSQFNPTDLSTIMILPDSAKAENISLLEQFYDRNFFLNLANKKHTLKGFNALGLLKQSTLEKFKNFENSSHEPGKLQRRTFLLDQDLLIKLQPYLESHIDAHNLEMTQVQDTIKLEDTYLKFRDYFFEQYTFHPIGLEEQLLQFTTDITVPILRDLEKIKLTLKKSPSQNSLKNHELQKLFNTIPTRVFNCYGTFGVGKTDFINAAINALEKCIEQSLTGFDLRYNVEKDEKQLFLPQNTFFKPVNRYDALENGPLKLAFWLALIALSLDAIGLPLTYFYLSNRSTQCIDELTPYCNDDSISYDQECYNPPIFNNAQTTAKITCADINASDPWTFFTLAPFLNVLFPHLVVKLGSLAILAATYDQKGVIHPKKLGLLTGEIGPNNNEHLMTIFMNGDLESIKSQETIFERANSALSNTILIIGGTNRSKEEILKGPNISTAEFPEIKPPNVTLEFGNKKEEIDNYDTLLELVKQRVKAYELNITENQLTDLCLFFISDDNKLIVNDMRMNKLKHEIKKLTSKN
tara:strand:+ start:1268 stop:3574 length:2307 start_codon:yes stop_codon:yes gene_type:complete